MASPGVEVPQDKIAAFCRKVDLVEKDCLRNRFRRHAILKSAEALHAG